MQTYDVVVVGSGPGGVSAAFFLKHLTKKPLKVLLVEKLDDKDFNVYHRICGEAMNGFAFSKMLCPLKPEAILEHIKFLDLHSKSYRVRVPVKGYVINRVKFFKSVRQKFVDLGGEFKYKTLLGLQQFSDKVVLKFKDGETISTKYVIAADGANSGIRAQLGVKPKYILPLVQYYTDHEAEKGALQFHFGEAHKPLYKWIFPSGDVTKIGFIATDTKQTVEGNILRKHARVVCYGGLDHYVYDKVLLVGEAAGQTNALTKGGIVPAMVAGRWAAEAVLRDSPKGYEVRWKKSGYDASNYENIFMNFSVKMMDKDFDKFMRSLGSNFTPWSYVKALRNWKSLPDYLALRKGLRYAW